MKCFNNDFHWTYTAVLVGFIRSHDITINWSWDPLDLRHAPVLSLLQILLNHSQIRWCWYCWAGRGRGSWPCWCCSCGTSTADSSCTRCGHLLSCRTESTGRSGSRSLLASDNIWWSGQGRAVSWADRRTEKENKENNLKLPNLEYCPTLWKGIKKV